MDELAHLQSVLVPQAALMLRQELKDKMRRAMDGQLKYGPRRIGGDVEHMLVTRDVLELRLNAYPGDDGTHVVRLYFSEPEELPSEMVTLYLTWKIPGPTVKEEQDAQAVMASKRLQEHCARPKG
jgi:hypothetical protein